MGSVWIIESRYDDGDHGWTWDGRHETEVFATRELADAEKERRDSQDRKGWERRQEADRLRFDREKAEHQALVAAGLRQPSEYFAKGVQPAPFASEYKVEELTLITERQADLPTDITASNIEV